MPDPLIVWGAATVVLLLVELATYGLTSIWLAIGAACAFLAALLGAPLWLQILWFVLISAVTLLLTRPLAMKYVNNRAQPTNADRVIGAEAVVREAIDNDEGAGAVYADGKVWSARSAGGEPIPAGTRVRVRSIEGVKLIVSAATAPERGQEE